MKIDHSNYPTNCEELNKANSATAQIVNKNLGECTERGGKEKKDIMSWEMRTNQFGQSQSPLCILFS